MRPNSRRYLRNFVCVMAATVAATLTTASAWIAVSADEPETTVEESEARFDKLVREDIFEGFNGDGEAMKRGLAKCDEVLAKNPKHAEAMVWRGGARVFKAGQAFSNGNPGEGMKLWTTGLKDMDTAVELEPNNLAVRIPRAAVLMPTSLNVPEFMAKPLLEKSKADFEKILAAQKGMLDQLGEHPLGELRMGLADVYRRLGDLEKSQAQLEEIKLALPNTEYSSRALKWLAADATQKLSHNCIGCHSD